MKRRVRRATVLALVVWAGGGVAGPYDGVYVPRSGAGDPDLGACPTVPILIAEGRIAFYEVTCEIWNPVEIRAMDAVLYDGRCRMQEAEKQGRVMIRRMASGDVALVTPFMDVQIVACRAEG